MEKSLAVFAIVFPILLSSCGGYDRCFDSGGVLIDGFCNCGTSGVNADDTYCKTRLKDVFKNVEIEDDFLVIHYLGSAKGIRRDTQVTEHTYPFGSWFELASDEYKPTIENHDGKRNVKLPNLGKNNLPNVNIHKGEYAMHVIAPDLGLAISVPDYPQHIDDEWQFSGCKFQKKEELEPLIEVSVSQYAYRGFCEEENVETIYWTVRNLGVVGFKVLRPSETDTKKAITYLNLAATSQRGILQRIKEPPNYVPQNKL